MADDDDEREAKRRARVMSEEDRARIRSGDMPRGPLEPGDMPRTALTALEERIEAQRIVIASMASNARDLESRVLSLQCAVAAIERRQMPMLTGPSLADQVRAGLGRGERIQAISLHDPPTIYWCKDPDRTKQMAAVFALRKASVDFDEIQRRLLEEIAGMKLDAAPADTVIRLADIATSLGDCSAVCAKAARENGP